MNRNLPIFVATASALLSLGAVPAQAAGTLAGTVITNNVRVNYQVGTIAQTELTQSRTVTVDRVINMTLAEADGGTTIGIPGQKGVVMAYTLTNTSNAPLDFGPSLVSVPKGEPAIHGGINAFAPIYRGFAIDTNGNNIYESGIDTFLSNGNIDEVEPDTARTLFFLADVPQTQRNGDISAFNIAVTAREGGKLDLVGDFVEQSVSADTDGVDTVYADAAGPGLDQARDGRLAIADDITVFSASLSILRTSRVITNPVESANYKAIPGATVEYCVLVSNASDAATANGVAVTDQLGAELDFDTDFGVYLEGTALNGECNADGNPGGGYNAGIVSGSLATIAPGETKTVRYRAKVK